MKFVIFGGTTEGRMLSSALAEAGAEVLVCVATAYGREEQERVGDAAICTGPLSAAEKASILQDAALCVDATHPYAVHVSKSVKDACAAAGVRLLRLERTKSALGGARLVASAEEAAAYLLQREGNILLSTGAKELPAFRALAPERLFPRVLPSLESISACEALRIPHRNIIAMQGPFSREMNIATIRQYAIRYLVSKDGGGPGGFAEKLAAAEETGAELIVLRRPEESGLGYDEVLNTCMTMLRHCGK